MKICLTVCRVLKGILIALCVYILIVVPLLIMFTTYDGPSPSMEVFFQIVIELLPLFSLLLALLFPLVAAEGWLQYKLGWIDGAKLKRRVWIMAICEIILLAIILVMLLESAGSNHTVLSWFGMN